MTRNDLSENTDHRGPTAKRIALTALAVLGIAFSGGMAFGFLSAVQEHGLGSPWKAAAVLTGIAALIAGMLVVLLRQIALMRGEVLSPRTRRARLFLAISLGLGVVFGFLLQIDADLSGPLFSGETPLPPVVALSAIALMVVVIPILTWMWWRNVDEHEASAYKDGALYAINAYSLVYPVWWVAWRGGFTSEPDGVIVFMITIAVWAIVWVQRRYG